MDIYVYIYAYMYICRYKTVKEFVADVRQKERQEMQAQVKKKNKDRKVSSRMAFAPDILGR
jgi:hypothetical protein